MQLYRVDAGVRNLKAIVATASSARILNLHGLAVEQPDSAAYVAKPMFVHPVLNRAIIAKHNVAPGEEERIAPRRFNATKIIFPFDPDDLNLGGQVLFVDEPDFLMSLTRRLEYGGRALERDVAVLRILDRLPTLDPFLVREVLAKQHIEVDACYYRLSGPDKERMLGFVEGQMSSLIRLCFGEEGASDKRARRMAKLLLADGDSDELAPLKATLQMDDEDFAEAMFAWKAFLYYRWRAQTLAPELKSTLRSIRKLSRRGHDADTVDFVTNARELLEAAITEAWRDIGQTLKLYDRAYQGLTEDQKPESFRRFLSDGASLFIDLGGRMGRLEQVVSYWTYRLDQHGSMSPDALMDNLRDLLQGLSIWPAAAAEDDPAAELAAAG
ncbi:MAG TPA: hypothetical protein VHZ26_03050 [Caulobacteraceae bacterium]|jgi:hypothetical protein|nr:hypothetical protein [Caulobacteraceae bacterium]